MAGIMDMFNGMFGSNPAPAPVNTAPAQPGNIPANSGSPANPTPGAASNGVVPPTTAPTVAAPATDPNTPATPLDPFNDLWKTDPAQQGQKPAAVFGNVDPKKFQEAASRVNFAGAITPDQVAAINQGGDAALQAFSTALNSVAQQVYAQSTFAATKMIDAGLAKAKEGFVSELPSHIKRQQVSDTIRSENPLFNNPAVQPIISALEAQLTMKHPNATATEIAGMAKQYIEALGTSFAPAPPVDPKKSVQQETDWSTFLN